MSSRLLTHAGRQPLRLPLRYAHRVPLHPGHYGRGLHRHSMRCTTRAVFASLTCTTPARLKGRATRPATTRSPRVTPFAETARAPCARYARRSPAGDGGLRGSGGEAPPDRCAYGFIERGGRGHRRGQAAPSRAGPRLNSAAPTRRPAGQRRITACVMRPFTPSHSPRRRGPRLGVHTLPFQAHPRAETEAFCSLGAARPRLRGR